MAKIPVGATIARAYRFTFADFFKILGVMWPSMLLLWVPSFFMRQQMTAVSMKMATNDYSGFRAMWPFFLIFYLAAFILIFMQMIGIAQIALDRRQGPVWFYFWLGRPVWRLVGNFLLLIVAFFIGWLVVALADALLALIMGWLAGLLGNGVLATIFGFLTVIAMLVPLCAFFYCVIRLAFLLVPVVAAEEEGLALARSWTLGLGNFWRMLVILVATLGPFIILEFAFVFGFMFKGLPFPPPHATAVEKAAFEAATNARMMEMMNGMYDYWYIVYPLMIAVMVVLYGLCTGAQCFAYRALTEGEASAPVTAD
jgi:hypothetical protein